MKEGKRMGGLFDIDSPVMNVLNKIMNLMILNLCFVAGCIPVFTAGAAMTALYSVNLKMVRNEESYIFSSYWRAFKENFRQSTACWLLLACAGGILGADMWAVRNLPGGLGKFLGGTTLIFLILYCVLMLYIFPYMARFQDCLGTCVKNAFLIGGSNPGCTVTTALVTAAFIALSVFSIEVLLRAIFLWLIIGFSLLSYIHSFFFRKVFDKYIDTSR